MADRTDCITVLTDHETQHGAILDVWARVWDAHTGRAIMVPVTVEEIIARRVNVP